MPGVKTIFAGSSCNDLVTLHDNNIVSGHFDKRVRFWDIRSDSSTNEIMLQGRLTSLNLAPGRYLWHSVSVQVFNLQPFFSIIVISSLIVPDDLTVGDKGLH